jgi:hypothetical protein
MIFQTSALCLLACSSVQFNEVKFARNATGKFMAVSYDKRRFDAFSCEETAARFIHSLALLYGVCLAVDGGPTANRLHPLQDLNCAP